MTPPKFKKILLLHKKSNYAIYFKNHAKQYPKSAAPILQNQLRKFITSHQSHIQTLQAIRRSLRQYDLDFDQIHRGVCVDYSQYDLIISAGGDGTFLEAARQVKKQIILGVNSDPEHSVGRFCIANKDNFEKIIQDVIAGHFKINLIHRMQVLLPQKPRGVEVLNDILICHSNPAMLSRYYFAIGKNGEEQFSSGLWISTAAGSTGAIYSAGGILLKIHENKIQYLPRELYKGKNQSYRFTGGIISSRQRLKITSLMPQGRIFIDGAHQHYPLAYGAMVRVRLSPHPLRTISV